MPRDVGVALVVALVVALLVGPAATADEVEVDAWGSDPNSLSGSIDEVCGPGPSHDAAADRPGRVALIGWLDEAFPDVMGFAGFACREIHNPRMDCAGRGQPKSSDCWSTHAAGRAIDVMVGGAGDQRGYPVGGEIGDRIVNTLLAPRHGVDNYLARVMGVQQLLWNGTCWNASRHGDAGITDVSQLGDDCVNLHDNHVHITLSEAGADGRTSFYSGEVVDVEVVEAEPIRDQWTLAYHRRSGDVVLRQLAPDGTFADQEPTEEELAKGWSAVATPDVGGNGDDEVFLYNARNGGHRIREIRDDGEFGSHLAGPEELEPGWSLVATPDIDGDGDDEVLLYRAEDGHWVLFELLENGELGPEIQAADEDDESALDAGLEVFFSSVATPDLDGDGDDELVLYRRFDGFHTVWDFTNPDGEPVEADDDDEDLAEVEEDEGDGDEDDVEPAVPPVPEVVMDGDEDGAVDAGVVLAPLSVSAAEMVPENDADDEESDDEDGESDEESDDEDGESDEESDDEVEAGDPADLSAPGTTLSAGFSTLATPDLDHDGRDELALYRDDGCLVIRTAGGAVVDDLADTDDVEDESDEDGDGEDGEPAQPCMVPADEADEDEDDDEPRIGVATDEDGEPLLLVTEGLDPTTWLLEAPTGLERGWSAVGTVSIGDEYLPDPVDDLEDEDDEG